MCSVSAKGRFSVGLNNTEGVALGANVSRGVHVELSSRALRGVNSLFGVGLSRGETGLSMRLVGGGNIDHFRARRDMSVRLLLPRGFARRYRMDTDIGRLFVRSLHLGHLRCSNSTRGICVYSARKDLRFASGASCSVQVSNGYAGLSIGRFGTGGIIYLRGTRSCGFRGGKEGYGLVAHGGNRVIR